MTERIAFIGFGEAGQTISRGLLAEGAPAIRTYDILFGQPAARRSRRRRARSASPLARDHADAVRGCRPRVPRRHRELEPRRGALLPAGSAQAASSSST